jgi:hypothetical protein
MNQRSRVIWYGSALLLVPAGIGGVIGFGGTFGQVLAIALIGLGLVLATALVFLEVGLSEDRERARETERREPPLRNRPRPRRLDRMRGRPRRLR